LVVKIARVKRYYFYYYCCFYSTKITWCSKCTSSTVMH